MVQFERQRRRGGAERVFDHVLRRPAERERHLLEAAKLACVLAPYLEHRPVLGDDGATAGMPVRDDRWILGILRDPDDRRVQTGLGPHQWIVGVQHHPAVRAGGAQDDALDLGQTSTVCTPCKPRWSPLTLIITLTSLLWQAIPRRRMPPAPSPARRRRARAPAARARPPLVPV